MNRKVLLAWDSMEMAERKEQKGVYHNDYSPRYQPAYDIYEKAKNHMKKQKKEQKKKKTEDIGPADLPLS